MKRKASFLLLLSVFLFAAVFPGMAQSDDTMRVPVQIDSAEVEMTPDGWVIHVSGSLGTGCDFPIDVEQSMDAGVLFVEIYQEVPVDVMCPMILIFYEETIPLEIDGMPRGVVVNDMPAAGLAQGADPNGEADLSIEIEHRPHIITDVSLDFDAEDGPQLIIEGFIPDDCEYPVIVDVFPANDPDAEAGEFDWLVIEIYRQIPPMVACPEIAIDFTEIVPIADLLVHEVESGIVDTRVVEVNDFLGWLRPAEMNGEANDSWILDPVEREFAVSEMVDVTQTAEGIAASIRGYYPGGCQLPVRERYEFDGDLLKLEIYRPDVNDLVPCPRMLLNFRTQIVIDAEGLRPGEYGYIFNDGEGEDAEGFFIVSADPEGRERGGNPVPHLIETVEGVIMTSQPPQVNLFVSGYIPDGCGAATRIDVEQEGNQINVEIYRLLPAGVACPMIVVDYQETIPLGTLEPGTYTINVNGVEIELDL